MNTQDFYMYSHSNRFTGNLTGATQYNSRYGQPFQMNTSAQHKQFHEMKAEMPSDVLELFKANEVQFLKAPVKPKCRKMDPVTTTIKNIIEMFDVPNEYLIDQEKPQTREQKKKRIAQDRKLRNQKNIDEKISSWNPFEDQKITSDPQKTLLVARLNHKTTQKSLKFQFEKYGIIKSVRIVRDSEGVSRGYGFVQFDSKSDFINAYKSANYRKIDGYKIIVDFEKGRTLLRWRPRRFGQGAGDLRLTKEQIEELDRKQRIKRKNRKQRERESRERSRSQGKKEKKYDQKEKKKERKSSKEKKDKKEKKEKKEKKQKKDKEKEKQMIDE